MAGTDAYRKDTARYFPEAHQEMPQAFLVDCSKYHDKGSQRSANTGDKATHRRAETLKLSQKEVYRNL
jgi:hypothetical protein